MSQGQKILYKNWKMQVMALKTNIQISRGFYTNQFLVSSPIILQGGASIVLLAENKLYMYLKFVFSKTLLHFSNAV